MALKTSKMFWLLSIEGIVCLMFLLLIPSDPKNAFLFGYSLSRIGMVIVLLVIVLLVSSLAFFLRRPSQTQTKINSYLEGSLEGQCLPQLFIFFFVGLVLISMAYIFAWIRLSELYGAVFLRFSPFILFILMLSATILIFTPRVYYKDTWALWGRTQYWLKRFDQSTKASLILSVLLLLIAGVVFFKLSTRHAEVVNQFPQYSDQNAYLRIAEQIQQTNYQYKGDRNRTPLFPYLLTLVNESSIDELEFFTRGKQLNILLSLGMFLVIFLLSLRFLPAIQAALLTLIAITSLYVYKAGYVQPELLYYTLSFASYVLMAWMLVRPSLVLGIATGLVTALAYLAKASILPGLALFVLIFVMQQAYSWYSQQSSSSDNRTDGIKLRKNIVALILVGVSFLALLFPYLNENKQMFGNYFYNVNSTFYIWYDSWEEVRSGTRSYGDNSGWPDMPPEQIPSLGKYLREHTPEQILERFKSGWRSQYRNISKPYGQFNYPAIYTLVLMVFGLFSLRKSISLLNEYKFIVLFFLLYILGHLVLFSWYSPIADFHDARFTYGLYLPYMFSMFVALKKIVERVTYLQLGGITIRTTSILWSVHALVLVLVFYELAYVVPRKLRPGWWYAK